MPWIYTSCAGTYASLYPIRSSISACLSCLIGETPQTNEASCDIIGVHAPLIPIVAGFQISLLTRMLLDEDFEYNTFYQLDNWDMTFNKLKIQKRKECLSCGGAGSESLVFSDQPILLCGKDSVQFRLPNRSRAEFPQIGKRLLAERISYTENPFILSFIFSGFEFSIFKNGRVLIHGTSDLAEAKKVYQHFFN